MQSMIQRDYIKKPIVIILLSLLLGVLTNLDFMKDALSGESKLTIEEKVEEIGASLTRITLDQASEDFMEGEALFVDARDPDSFDAGHIPGAINVSWEDMQYNETLILEQVPKGVPVITYCDGSDCQASLLLAGAMKELGYEDVRVFFGGWVEWEDAEYPIEEGSYE